MATATTLTIISSGSPFLIITQNDDTQLEQFIVLSHIDPILLLFPDIFKLGIIHKI
jgi:hypothetical protein